MNRSIIAPVALATLFASGCAYSATARKSSASAGRETIRNAAITSHQDDATRMLAMHNRERERLGLPQLRWNTKLEQDARHWSRHLARKGALQHAERSALGDTGENLWMGTAGYWDAERMVGMFIEEGRNFRSGAFPEISRTGNWYDAGHYSQIVWRDTQEVGCSVATEGNWDVLVCRYWPAGNVIGQKPY